MRERERERHLKLDKDAWTTRLIDARSVSGPILLIFDRYSNQTV